MLFDIQDHERRIFNLISESAKELNCRVYVVGGYVRDRILGRQSKDMDIVCLGSGIDLAHKVASQLYPAPKVAFYKRFGTAMLRHGNLEIEFVLKDELEQFLKMELLAICFFVL